MTRSHFKKVHDKKLGYYWVRAKLQGTKNHPDDSQDLRKGGIIIFEENENHLNSGLYFEYFMKFLNPESDFLFQLPKYGKAFTQAIHKRKRQEVYFYKSKVGHTLVGQMMPKVNMFDLNEN